MRILLVEDEQSLADGLKKILAERDFAVDVVSSGHDALAALRGEPFDLVVLDLGLPDIDGLSVLKQMRRQGNLTPTLILTARDRSSDKVIGLDSGADDYLIKPFDVSELLARIRALSRRQLHRADPTLRLGTLSLHPDTMQVEQGGKAVDCSRREYMLLKTLMEHPGKVFTREQLETKLYAWGEEVASNAIEVHVHHLRKKLGNDTIKTVRGVGYVMAKS